MQAQMMNLDANSLKTILAIQGGNMNTKNTGGGTISLNKPELSKSTRKSLSRLRSTRLLVMPT